ncbi:5108_t:CDS:10 [Gigaspora margarita]|uniref:5108_t:CDS:1 n=1 Tax=Gigaspora margarita TaxID=4874 RepID=A0ABN7UDR8_GIGMA|nr:5108_t:CDS:10 [Gigaspora margarita]
MQSNALSTHAKGNPTECFQTSDTGSNGRMPVGNNGHTPVENTRERECVFLSVHVRTMFESLLNDYFDHNPQKEWSIINALRYIEPKTELLSLDTINIFKGDMYSLLCSLSDKCYMHEFAKKKEFHISINRRVTSASTLRTLEEHHTDRIAIKDLRNAINTSTIEYDSERKHKDLRGDIMDEVENDQTVSEAVQELNDLGVQSYDQEDQDLLQNTNTLGKRENASDTEEERSPKFSESNQHSIFYGGLPSYEEGIEIDPELVLKETNEAMIPYFERSFNYDFWNCWTLKSGSVVTELLEKASNIKGHPLRPEVWKIIRCGFKIAKPKWLSNEEYTKIQSFAKRSSVTSPSKDIIELLKIKSLKSLGFEPDVSEADYGGYLIHPCLKKILVGLEDCLYYHISRRKCTSSYEQKSDGIFTIKLRKSLMEVGHLEMSGGYGHKDIPHSTWDGGCKLPKGNSYMLEEIGEQFRENHIELWQMYNLSRGALQYRRSHKSIVPICYEEHRKHIFDFIVLLWDLKSLDTQCGLLETSSTIFQLRDEHNDNLFESSKLSGSLPTQIGIKDANEDSDLDNSPIRSGRNDKK